MKTGNFGYETNMPFEQGLINTIEWSGENWDRIEESVDSVRGVSQKKQGE